MLRIRGPDDRDSLPLVLEYRDGALRLDNTHVGKPEDAKIATYQLSTGNVNVNESSTWFGADPVGSMTAKARPYFPELDGVRAIAALMVMAFHYGQSSYASRLLVFGQTGVDLFFVLSGFLITTILLQSRQGDWQEIKKFYIRRTLRIFPLYYGYLILASLITGAISIWYWLYLQNLAISFSTLFHRPPPYGPGHFWSLAVEEQFYLAWPFLILFSSRKRLSSVMWACVALALVLRVFFVHSTMGVFYLTFTRMDSLCAGGLLAYYYNRGVLTNKRRSLSLIGILALSSLYVEKLSSHGTGLAWVETTKYTSAAALYFALIGIVITTKESVAHRFLRSTPMRGVGRVSYGLYVYHPAVFSFLLGHLWNLPFLVKPLVCFTSAYIVSVASFYGFEKPCTDLKSRLAPEPPMHDAQIGTLIR